MIDLALSNKIFINSRIEAAIQELDIIFSTDIGELIGDTNYGTNWYQFLNVLTPMVNELTRYIYAQINQTYYCRQLDYKVVVDHIPEDASSTYLVQITLEDKLEKDLSKNKRIKVYQIS